ncbi:MAG: hypothetical protein KAU90_12355 [Sulfurovaceae bacterium]|nr:hypothetical protein [Sulfurovaceae bacterium]
MKLDELIKSEGLEVVSEKTNISENNLNKLVNLDFEGLNRVKALGFLSILRREYGIELDTIEDSIKSYFVEHVPDDSEPVLVSVDREEDKSYEFLKWIIILAILGVFWYLYSVGKLDKLLTKNADNQETNLTETEELKSNLNNISEDNVQKSIIIKKEDNQTKVEINTDLITKEQNNTESNVSLKDSITIVAQIPQKKGKKEENKTIIISKDAGVEEPSKKVVEVIDSDTDKEDGKDNKNQTITNITINPTRGMLWYGFINIKTKKKKEFMRNKSTPFDLKGGKWILVTGHGFLDVVSEVKTLSIADRHRHYFYIDGKKLKEISRKEFIRLNHGRMW